MPIPRPTTLDFFRVIASALLLWVIAGLAAAQGSEGERDAGLRPDLVSEVTRTVGHPLARTIKPRGKPELSIHFSGERVRLVVQADRVIGVSRKSVSEVRVRRQGAVFALSHLDGKRWATRWRQSIGMLASLQGRLVATVFVLKSGLRFVTKARVPKSASEPTPNPTPEQTSTPTPEPTPNPTPPTGVSAPGLVPDWSETVTDYTVTCREPIILTVNVGGPVAVNGRTPQSGPIREELDLDPGQAFRLSGTFGEHVFRCRPADLPVPAVEGQGSGSFYLVTPTLFGSTALTNYAMVLDRNGVPIWWYRAPDPWIIDFNMPKSGVLSWVQSIDPGSGFARSFYTLQSFSGPYLGSVHASGFRADNHDLQPTPDGGWLVMGYVERNCPSNPGECEDLSPWGGPSQANVIDGWIQKLDARGNPLWTWKSQDHIDLAESGPWVPSLGAGTLLPDGTRAFDIIHLNSVEPDGNGFIFSARHLDAVYRVEDPSGTGTIDWKLGGTATPESLAITGDPFGSDPLGGQHDARRLADGTVTIHDNGTGHSRPPRMVRYQIDPVAGTADLVSELSDERVTGSICCGGGRVLPDGNGWAVSWGASAVMGEYQLDGTPRLRMTWPDGKHSYRIVPVSPSVLTIGMLRNGMEAQFPRSP